MKTITGFFERNFKWELEMVVQGTVIGKSIIMAAFMTLAQVVLNPLWGVHRPARYYWLFFSGIAIAWIPYVLGMRAIARKRGIVKTNV